jgi:anti-anti-sigma factor
MNEAPGLGEVQVERPASRTAVVTFTGEHDLGTKEAVEALLDSLVAENDLVVADFSEARFVDAAMIGALLDADLAARTRGSTLRLQLGTLPIVRRAFEVCGVLEQLDCASSREEALGKSAPLRDSAANGRV